MSRPHIRSAYVDGEQAAVAAEQPGRSEIGRPHQTRFVGMIDGNEFGATPLMSMFSD